MPTKIKVLSVGTISTSAVTVSGPVAQGKSLLVKNMRFVNTGVSARYLYLTIQRSGEASRYVIPSGTQIAANAMYQPPAEIALEYNDSLQASLDAAGTVDYILGGVERDA